MIRIRLVSADDRLDRFVDLPAAPRRGDRIRLDGVRWKAIDVEWLSDSSDAGFSGVLVRVAIDP